MLGPEELFRIESKLVSLRLHPADCGFLINNLFRLFFIVLFKDGYLVVQQVSKSLVNRDVLHCVVKTCELLLQELDAMILYGLLHP